MENVAIIMILIGRKWYFYSKWKDIVKYMKNKYKYFNLCIINEFHVLINNNKYIIDISTFSFDNNKTSNIKSIKMIHGKPKENGELCKYFEDKKYPIHHQMKRPLF